MYNAILAFFWHLRLVTTRPLSIRLDNAGALSQPASEYLAVLVPNPIFLSSSADLSFSSLHWVRHRAIVSQLPLVLRQLFAFTVLTSTSENSLVVATALPQLMNRASSRSSASWQGFFFRFLQLREALAAL